MAAKVSLLKGWDGIAKPLIFFIIKGVLDTLNHTF